MALIAPPDRVLETSTTTGTGTYTLAGAMTGYRAASAVCANGDTAYYYAEDVDGSGVPTGGWETGIGTWGTGDTLARTTVHTSSNANAAVSWAAGTRRISLSLTAAKVSAMAASTLPLTITKSGTWINRPAFTLVSSCNMDIGGVVIDCSGPWASRIYYDEGGIGSGVTALSFDDLVGVGSFVYLYNCAGIVTLSFPALKKISAQSLYAGFTGTQVPYANFVVSYASALTTVSLSAIVSIDSGISFPAGTDALTSFTFGTTLKHIGGDIDLSSCALTQASVDDILARLAALDGTGGTISYDGPRTVTITGTSSTPSAAGIVSAAILTARGVTVTTN